MTYQELVEKVTEVYAGVNASSIKEHIAVQYNVYGEGEGAFYIEVANGKIEVAPFEYYDRDATIAVAGEALYDIVSLKSTYAEVEEAGRLVVVGNVDKAEKLMSLALKKATKKAAVKKAETKAPAKKTPAKKAPAKKAPVKKAETKTTAKKAETKTTAKKAEAKAPAKKAEAQKTEK